MTHAFTPAILAILAKHFGKAGADVMEASPLLQYINTKTRSATRGSKSRGSFANLYAIYVLVEDYVQGSFHSQGDYQTYAGAIYSTLFKRQRELPFGSKLQNHALNHRLNEEFKKYFPTVSILPIIRDTASSRYWINQNLLRVSVAGQSYDLAPAIIEIIEAYIESKKDAFDAFIRACNELNQIPSDKPEIVHQFIAGLLAPNVDARLFEIVGYAILKYFYRDQKVYFGYSLDDIAEESLILYKTGRTNANDGGIDYVMRPLGRFFQVTETLDVRKYFLDIDKIERFPITFVIKSTETVEALRLHIETAAWKQFSVATVVNNYMNCVEEIINIPILNERFESTVREGHLRSVMNEIVVQSMVEFNYSEDLGEEDVDDE